MSRFKYVVKVNPKKISQGIIEADSKNDAINIIANKGFFPISIIEDDISLPNTGFFSKRKISRRDMAIFIHQLSILIGSGVPIIRSLDVYSEQTSNKFLKSIVLDMRKKISEGSTLSDCFLVYENLFPKICSSMINAGEVSGNLEHALKKLADFIEKEEEFNESIIAALTYPVFVFCVGSLTIFILIGFVIPKFVSMFNDMGQELPFITQVLISFSNFIKNSWWALMLFFGFIILLVRKFYDTTSGRLIIDGIKIKIFILKEIIFKSEINRLMRTLSLLLSSGIAPIQAIDIASSTIKNTVLKTDIENFKDKIIKGSNFTACVNESNYFPNFISSVIAVGEETGTLEKSLLNIADEYERDLDRSLKIITRLLEPIIILIMGVIVGYSVLAMLLPIFQMNLNIR